MKGIGGRNAISLEETGGLLHERYLLFLIYIYFFLEKEKKKKNLTESNMLGQKLAEGTCRKTATTACHVEGFLRLHPCPSPILHTQTSPQLEVNVPKLSCTLHNTS